MSEPITRENSTFLELEDRAYLFHAGLNYINDIADEALAQMLDNDENVFQDEEFQKFSAQTYISSVAELTSRLSTGVEDGEKLIMRSALSNDSKPHSLLTEWLAIHADALIDEEE